MAALGNDTVISQETAQAYAQLSGAASVGGFNWADAFAKALKSMPKVLTKTVITIPKPSIDSLSKSGELLIIFDQIMNVPPLEIIRGQKVLVKGKKVPALELKLKPGYYSDPDNLTFSYNITAVTPRTISLKLNFDVPQLISSLDDPD